MKLETWMIFVSLLFIVSEAQLPFTIDRVGKLRTDKFKDGRPSAGSAKHATWLGDWNGDGRPEYFVSTKKGGTSTLFYSVPGGKWKPTSHWYLPSYSVIALDTTGDARPEYLIKTSKYKKDDNTTIEIFADHAPGIGQSWTSVLKIPDDPINNPLIVVMTFDRAVPSVQGCIDIDGDGYKDLILTHHLVKAEFVSRYYKGKDDSVDGKPFEDDYKWASEGKGSSMGPNSNAHKARWGDITVLKGAYAYGSPDTYRLFAVGSKSVANNVLYWDYIPDKDRFNKNPQIMDVTEASDDNKLFLTTVRALPGAIMLAGPSGAFFFKYMQSDDTYKMIPVPGLLPGNYSDFWCIPSGVRNDLMVFILLRKVGGNGNSVLEFRTFDTTLGVISDNLDGEEIYVSSNAQRITVLREDDSFDVSKMAKQLIVAHSKGATIYEIKYN